MPFLDNYWPVFDLPFLEYLIELMILDQLGSTLKEVDYWEPFQSKFRPGFGMKMILATVLNDTGQDLHGHNAPFWFYWTSLQFLTASTIVSYWTIYWDWRQEHYFTIVSFYQRVVSKCSEGKEVGPGGPYPVSDFKFTHTQWLGDNSNLLKAE